MMILASDVPEEVSRIWGQPLDWQEGLEDVPGLSPAWDLLDQGRVVHTAHLDESSVPCLMILGDAASSQFDQILQGMRDGIHFPDGFTAMALEGRGFHGNRGRPWSAVKGNIHLCSIFDVARTAGELKAGLSMVPTVAVTEAIRRAAPGLSPGIKWVNDVELSGAKVSGTLTSTQSSGGMFDTVLFGIGVNVHSVPKVESTPFVPAAGCIGQHVSGQPCLLRDVLLGVLSSLRSAMDRLLDEGVGRLLKEYQASSSIIGEEVRIWSEEAGQDPARLAETPPLGLGRVSGFDENLQVYLEGQSEPVNRGRLVRASSCSTFGL